MNKIMKEKILDLLKTVYNTSPRGVQKLERKIARHFMGRTIINDDFVNDHIGQDSFLKYKSEYAAKNIIEGIAAKQDTFEQQVNTELYGFGSLNYRKEGIVLYALVRKYKPNLLVETGVCNGVSTWIVLEAMRENKNGTLYSIDYPFYTGQNIEQFKNKTYSEFGGAATLAGKKPGWIIPEKLKARWNFYEGKSQKQMPKLLSNIENIDFFIHDSEHSVPCMMFEYELAYQHLDKNGIIISDDIVWNKAFSLFVNERDVQGKLVTKNMGAIIPNS